MAVAKPPRRRTSARVSPIVLDAPPPRPVPFPARVFLRAPLVLPGWDIHFLLNGQATSTSGRRELREDDGCGDAAASEAAPRKPL
jgi:hypothetical protein